MRNSLHLLLFLFTLNVGLCQDCCEEDGDKIDTNTVILNIQKRFKHLNSLKESDFEYIYTKESNSGCIGSNNTVFKVKYLNGEIAVKQKFLKEDVGCGPGYHLRHETTEYFERDKVIFVFEVKSESEDDTQKRTIQETRTYYDLCGRTVRKLIKKASSNKDSSHIDLKKTLIKTPNKDITPKLK